MKKMFDRQNKNRDAGPSCPERRTFVKGMAVMGAGVAASPLLTNTAEAQVPAAADKGTASESLERSMKSLSRLRRARDDIKKQDLPDR